MKKYVMAFDEGTTSARCVLYDREGNTVSTAQKEFKQIFPQNGWVEHDPMEIWSVQIGVAQEAMYKINCTFKDIAAIGITNQRETTVVWDKNTGVPIYNAIVWQCRRTAEYCDSLKNADKTDMIKEKNRPANRPIFFCNKTQMDTRKCPWCKGKGCKRRAFIWNHRNMAHMETDFRACSCYGLHKCSQNNDV